MKTLVFSDVHLESGIDVDPSYKTIKNVISKEKFDRIIIAGDLMDFSYISRWVEDLPLFSEGKRLNNDLKFLESELTWIKKYCKDITYLSGNHEDRVQKLIAKNPVLEGIISLGEICRKIGVTYIETEQQPYKIYDDLFIGHGLALTKYCASKNVETCGVSVITGHSHRTQSFTTSQLNGIPMTGYSIGCVSSLNPGYVAGKRISGWSQSFGILYNEGSMWDFNLIMIKRNSCIVNGKVYRSEGGK